MTASSRDSRRTSRINGSSTTPARPAGNGTDIGTLGIQIGPDGVEPAVKLGHGLAVSTSGDLSVGGIQVTPEPTPAPDTSNYGG